MKKFHLTASWHKDMSAVIEAENLDEANERLHNGDIAGMFFEDAGGNSWDNGDATEIDDNDYHYYLKEKAEYEKEKAEYERKCKLLDRAPDLVATLRQLIFDFNSEFGQESMSAQFASTLSDAIVALEKATGETLTGESHGLL